jgi:hypothetical protein
MSDGAVAEAGVEVGGSRGVFVSCFGWNLSAWSLGGKMGPPCRRLPAEPARRISSCGPQRRCASGNGCRVWNDDCDIIRKP